jgi:hypothetical protein
MDAIYTYVIGDTAVAQIVQAVLLVVIAYTVLQVGNGLINIIETYSRSTTSLLPYLYDSTQTIYQNPSQQGAITVYPSTNAPAGLEFSYSCFLMLNKTSFHGTSGLRHIFHKGSPTYKPLMCPGVFVKSNENTLVVYMNELNKWDSHCEIPNIPIGKFFHLAIVVRNRAVDIYINGNVVHRMTLDTVPKQNFGDVYVFNTQSYSDRTTSPDAPFTVDGAAQGLISRLLYTGYALNYEQIDRMMRQGPSTNLVSASQNLPPYLADNWWVTYYKA